MKHFPPLVDVEDTYPIDDLGFIVAACLADFLFMVGINLGFCFGLCHNGTLPLVSLSQFPGQRKNWCSARTLLLLMLANSLLSFVSSDSCCVVDVGTCLSTKKLNTLRIDG